jgi:hypothetical protein
MSTTGISGAASLLDSYDPTDPSTLDSGLTSSGLSDTYYQDGVNGVDLSDPGSSGISATSATTASVSTASSATTSSSGTDTYEQDLEALQQWQISQLASATYDSSADAILGTSQAAAFGTQAYQNAVYSNTVNELDAAAAQQNQEQAAAQQAALTAANNAINAGYSIDTTA